MIASFVFTNMLPMTSHHSSVGGAMTAVSLSRV